MKTAHTLDRRCSWEAVNVDEFWGPAGAVCSQPSSACVTWHRAVKIDDQIDAEQVNVLCLRQQCAESIMFSGRLSVRPLTPISPDAISLCSAEELRRNLAEIFVIRVGTDEKIFKVGDQRSRLQRGQMHFWGRGIAINIPTVRPLCVRRRHTVWRRASLYVSCEVLFRDLYKLLNCNTKLATSSRVTLVLMWVFDWG